MQAQQHRHLVIVNPSAGGGRAAKLVPRVEAALAGHDLAYELLLSRSVEHACAAARDAAARGETVVVVSGDGLIGQIAGVLAGTDGTLGIIPGGRGNDLARVLEIANSVEDAVALLAARPVRAIDVGAVNGRPFLGIASCGFDSDANRIANEARLIRGSPVYAYAALRALASWKPARFTVTAGGRRHEFRGYSVAVGNSRAYGGGMMIAPDASLDDGELDVICSEHVSKLSFLANLRKVFEGTHVALDAVTVLRAPSVTIEADRPFDVYADGDRQAELPATITVSPGALRTIAPLA